MAHIGDRRLEGDIRELYRSSQNADRFFEEVLQDMKRNLNRAQELVRVQVRDLAPANQQKLAQLLAQQLKGQLPPDVAKSLIGGDADPGVLQQLAQRYGAAMSSDPNLRTGRAATAESARQAAQDPSLPQQALRWASFVQKATHIPGSGVQGRAGSASPKGEGTTLIEIIASRMGTASGPGLRSPRLVQRAMGDLSPAQRHILMVATFGEHIAGMLEALGITDPLMLVKAGALPGDRADLAAALNMPRARLLGLLMRAELLKIGPGRNGELGMRPDLLGPLKGAGIAMMGTLAALRGLSQEEIAKLYRKLRLASGGFRGAINGGRIPVKRDLMHWARTAARKRSDILLADSEEYLLGRGGGMGSSDAEELIQAWYLENLLWEELADVREEERLEDYLRRRREEERGDEEQGEDDMPDLEPDEGREDPLMCFWITDHNPDGLRHGSTRRMYVCVDPETGAIIPQAIEEDQALPK